LLPTPSGHCLIYCTTKFTRCFGQTNDDDDDDDDIIAAHIEHLTTMTSNQFGFKKSHSTIMPTSVLKDLPSFYSSRATFLT